MNIGLFSSNFLNIMEREIKEYLVLKSIKEGEETIRQRDIARIVGISLGMTNTIIKTMISKGFLKASSIDKKKVSYILTKEGLNVLSKRSYSFFKKTIKNVVVYKDAIDNFIGEIKNEGYKSINLVENTDFDFLIEYSSIKNNLHFTYNDLGKNSRSKDIDEDCILRYLDLKHN